MTWIVEMAEGDEVSGAAGLYIERQTHTNTLSIKNNTTVQKQHCFLMYIQKPLHTKNLKKLMVALIASLALFLLQPTRLLRGMQ